MDDSFGGFAEELLNNIRDEFSKATILTFGIMTSNSDGNEVRRNTKVNDILDNANKQTKKLSLPFFSLQ